MEDGVEAESEGTVLRRKPKGTRAPPPQQSESFPPSEVVDSSIPHPVATSPFPIKKAQSDTKSPDPFESPVPLSHRLFNSMPIPPPITTEDNSHIRQDLFSNIYSEEEHTEYHQASPSSNSHFPTSSSSSSVPYTSGSASASPSPSSSSPPIASSPPPASFPPSASPPSPSLTSTIASSPMSKSLAPLNTHPNVGSTSSTSTLTSSSTSTPTTPVKSSPYSSRNTSKPTSPAALSLTRDGSVFPQHSQTPSWEPNYGDLVWVQTHSSFPYWPAYICDPAAMPPETQAMAAAALSKSKRAPSSSKKYALYMYASALFDFARLSQIKEYAAHRDELSGQNVEGTFAQLFPQAVALADKELLLPPSQRASWVMSKPPPTSHLPTIESAPSSPAHVPESEGNNSDQASTPLVEKNKTTESKMHALNGSIDEKIEFSGNEGQANGWEEIDVSLDLDSKNTSMHETSTYQIFDVMNESDVNITANKKSPFPSLHVNTSSMPISAPAGSDESVPPATVTNSDKDLASEHDGKALGASGSDAGEHTGNGDSSSNHTNDSTNFLASSVEHPGSTSDPFSRPAVHRPNSGPATSIDTFVSASNDSFSENVSLSKSTHSASPSSKPPTPRAIKKPQSIGDAASLFGGPAEDTASTGLSDQLPDKDKSSFDAVPFAAQDAISHTTNSAEQEATAQSLNTSSSHVDASSTNNINHSHEIEGTSVFEASSSSAPPSSSSSSSSSSASMTTHSPFASSTDNPFTSAPPPTSSSNTTSDTSSRSRTTSGPRFTGRAQVVSGASPFDSGPSMFGSSTSSSWGAPSSIKGGVSIKGTSAPQAAPSTNSPALFSAVPDGAFGSAPTSRGNPFGGAFDTAPAASPFSSAPIASNSDVFSAPPPGTITRPLQSGRNLTANDIFSQAPPVSDPFAAGPPQDHQVDPFAPPTAPGVKRPPVAPTSTPRPAAQLQQQTAPALPTPSAPPAGMIATPHGFIKAPSSQSHPTVTPPLSGQDPFPSEPPLPPATSMKPPSAHSSPFAKPRGISESSVPPLASHVQKALQGSPHGSWTDNAPPSTQLGMGAPSLTNVNTGSSKSGRSNAGRPVCPVVAFGFGGTVAIMIPKAKTTLNPLLVTPEDVAKPFKLGPVHIYKMANLLKQASSPGVVALGPGMSSPFAPSPSLSQGNDRVEETAHFLSLVSAFPGTLCSIESGKSTVTEADIRNFIMQNIEKPLSSSLADSFFDGICSRHTYTTSEKLLWSLLLALMDLNGSVKSSAGVSDPNSPESAIIKILLGGDGVTADMRQLYSASSTLASSSSQQRRLPPGEVFALVESLLMKGNRDEAAQLAVDNHEWGLALLLGSVCSQAKYQQVARNYAEVHFPQSSPLHLATMLYTNQAMEVVGQAAKKKIPLRAGGTVPDEVPSITGGGHVPSNETVLSLWRRNLATILSNKGSDWAQLACCIGDKLASENKDIMSAHFAYVCSGALPSAPKRGSSSVGRYTLLGCDMNKRTSHRSMSDCISVSALRMTEVLEWVISKGIANSNASKTEKSSSSALGSLGGLLGLGGSKDKDTTSSGGSGSTSSPTSAECVGEEMLQQMRQVLCPHKLRFALVLADLGFLKEAASYAHEAKALVNMCGAIGAPPTMQQQQRQAQGTASSTSSSTQQFSKKFVFALDEFIDRLTVLDPSLSLKQGSATQATEKSKIGSFWALDSVINVFSVANLKDLVDGPTAPPSGPPTTSTPHPHTSTPGQPYSQSEAFGGGYKYDIPSVGVPNNPSVTRSGGPPGGMPMEKTQSFASRASSNDDFVNHYVDLDTSSGSPFAGQHAQAQSNYGQPRQQPPQPHFHQQMQQQSGPPNPWGNSNSSNSNKNNSNSNFNMNHMNSLPPQQVPQLNPPHQQPPQQQQMQQQQMQQPPSQQQQQQQQQPPQQKPSQAAPSKEKPSAAEPTGNGGIGVVGKMRKSLLGFLYPDAHDATENLGTQMEAYYDEKTKKWVFPGEDPSASNDPASAPPPTGPIGMMGSSASSSSMNGSMSGMPPMGGGGGPPGFGAGGSGPGAAPSGGGNDAYDPLAALMAPPPPRTTSYASAPVGDDPLSMLMAPPSRSLPTMGGGGAGGPPVTGVKMWQPPPMSASVSASNPFMTPPLHDPTMEQQQQQQNQQQPPLPSENNLGLSEVPLDNQYNFPQ